LLKARRYKLAQRSGKIKRGNNRFPRDFPIGKPDGGDSSGVRTRVVHQGNRRPRAVEGAPS